MDQEPRHHLDLAPRREELIRLGFSIVREAEGEFTAVRSAPAGTLAGICWTTIVRVRRVAHLDVRTILDDRASLLRAVPALDPPSAPRHSRTGRALLACYLADTADDEARRLAVKWPFPRCFTGHLQAGIFEASGVQSRCVGYAPAYWFTQPQVNWIIGRVLDPTSPDPGEPLSVASSLAWLARGNVAMLLFVLILTGSAVLLLTLACVALVFLMFGGVAAFLLTAP
jgi:hypothetical protein